MMRMSQVGGRVYLGHVRVEIASMIILALVAMISVGLLGAGLIVMNRHDQVQAAHIAHLIRQNGSISEENQTILEGMQRLLFNHRNDAARMAAAITCAIREIAGSNQSGEVEKCLEPLRER